MRNFKALLKAQFLSFLSGMGGKSKTKKPSQKNKGAKYIVLIFLGGIIFASAYLYTSIFHEILSLTGETSDILPIMLAVSVVVALIFSFYSATKVLFGFSDYDMLFSMPIRAHQVVVSKLVFSYLVDLLFTVLIVLPSLIFREKFGIELNALSLINVIIMILGAPLFSIFISTILGLVVALISSRAKRKALIETLFFLVILAGFFAVSIITSKNAQTTEEAMFIPMVQKLYFLYPLVVKGITITKYALLVFIIEIVAVVIPVAMVCAFYKKIHTLFVSKKSSKTYSHKIQKSSGAMKALYKKEIKRLFSSSLYVMNSLVGAFFALVSVIVISVFFIKIELSAVEGLGEAIIIFAPALLTFTCFMAPPTNCSISLEGKSFWILRTSPVPFNTIFNAKILTSLTFYLPVGIVSAVLVPISFGVDLLVGVLFALIAVLIPVLASCTGLLINLTFPMLDWENENKVIKQGSSVLFTMLLGFLITGVFGVSAYYINVKPVLLLLAMFILTTALTLTIYLVIINKGQAILEKKA